MIRRFRLLSLRPLIAQPLRSLVAVLAVAAGVALAVTIVVVQTSITASFDRVGEQLAGPTQLRVRGPIERGGLVPEVLDDVRALDHVNATIPMVQAVTLAGTGGGDERFVLALGVDCSVEAVIGPFACTPSVLGRRAPLAAGPSLVDFLGPRGHIRTNSGPVDAGAVLPVDALGEVNDGNVVVFGLSHAQEIFGRGDRLDVIYVEPAAGADTAAVRQDLEVAVGSVNRVLDAGDIPGQLRVVLVSILPLFGLLGLFALGTGAVLIHNITTLAVTERRRQIAAVGALGARPRTVRASIVGESALVGVVGGVVGAAAALPLAAPILDNISGLSERTAGVYLQVHAGMVPFVVGIALGGILGAGAALRPARRATRLDVAAELSARSDVDDARPRPLARRVVTWAVVVAVGLAACWLGQRDGALRPWQPAVGQLGLVIAIVGQLLCGGALAALLVQLVARRRSHRAATRLALANLSRAPGRTGVMSIAVAAAVGVAFLASSFLAGSESSIRQLFAQNIEGLNVATLDTRNSAGIDAQLPPGLIDTIGGMPGVARVDRRANVIVEDGGTLISIWGYDAPWLDQTVFDGTATRERLDEGEILVGAGVARTYGVRAGDDLALPTPRGPVTVRVQGVWEEGDLNGSNITMTFDQLQLLYGPQPTSGAIVVPAPGTDLGDLRGAIEAADLHPTLRVEDREAYLVSVVDSISDQMQPFWILQRGMVALAFVALLTTMLLVGAQRTAEFGLLAAVGASPATLRRMVQAEAVVVAVIGIVLGGVFGLVTLWAITEISPLLIGFTNPFEPEPAPLVTYGALMVVVALAAASLPARHATRVDVVEAMREE